MPPIDVAPPSGRYTSFAEIQENSILRGPASAFLAKFGVDSCGLTVGIILGGAE